MNITVIIFIIVILIPISVGLYRNWKVQSSPNQKIFSEGKVPNPLPNGQYKGRVTGYNGSWKGKKFIASSSSGINLIDNTEKYPFKTYIGKGLQDHQLDILKIDYNIPQNPFWLHFILDEIVQTAPGKFLGKVHINLIPGLPFTLGYFTLTNPGVE